MASDKKKTGSNLNEKQRRFVREYLKDLNMTKAAIRAGYSETSAHSHGSLLLKNNEVQELIKIAQEKAIKRTDVTVDRVVLELARIAFADITEFMEWATNNAGLSGGPLHGSEYVEQTTELKERKKVTPALHFDILKRDGHKCVICGATSSDDKLEVDHIKPIASGGKSVPDNLQTLCCGCNLGKGTKGMGVVVGCKPRREIDTATEATLKNSCDLTPDQAACISEILITESRLGVKKIKVKLASKEKALELLMRHLGMMNDNLNVNVVDLGDFAHAAEEASKDHPNDTP